MPIDERGTLYLDNSTLAATATCSTRGLLRHHYGYTAAEEKPIFAVGRAVHESLASYLSGNRIADALRVFDEHYRDYSRQHVEPELAKHESWARMTHANVRAILDTWMATHPLSVLPFIASPDKVEVPFEIPLGDTRLPNGAPEFVFIGRLDALTRGRADRKLYVTDHKTTSDLTPWWLWSFNLDSQMTGYCWAAQQKWGEPINGIYINGIEIAKLPSDPKRICKTHGVKYAECGPQHAKSIVETFSRAPETIAQWHRDAIHLARRYKSLVQNYGDDIEKLVYVRTQGTFVYKACDGCVFKEFCKAGRQTDTIDASLALDPWDPRDRGKEAA